MKKTICRLLLFLNFFPLFSLAQNPAVLRNPSACQLGLSIDDDTCPEDSPDYQPNIFSIEVEGVAGSRLGVDAYLKEVRLIIRHGWLNDLDIALRSPGGRTINLTSDNGGGEDNYGNPADMDCDSAVIFRNNACLSVAEAIPPYLEEAVRPEEHFYHFNDSITNPNGIWQLIVCDDVDEDAGTLEFVHLIFGPVSCLPIQEISSIVVDSTAAVVSLSPENFCGITVFEYGPPGFSPGTDSTAGPGGQILVMDACPPFTLTGLPELSNLDLYVRRYCPASGTFSGNTCGNALTTGCRPPPVTIETTFADETICSTLCGVPCEMSGVWRNAPASELNWIVHSGPVPTQGTGPEADANGDGKYVYLESSGSSCPNGSTAQLLSACLELQKAGSDTCHFSFNYHMYGSSIGSLRLEVTTDGGFSWQNLWQRSGDQGNRWHKEYLSLAQFPDGSTLQLRFVGAKGNGFRGDIALDHLVFYGAQLQSYPEREYYVDQDGDGYGSGEDFILSCRQEPPSGYTDNNLDCNDDNPDINPGRPEVPCDGIDDNCNGPDDDVFLPVPLSTNDTICSGEIPEVCAPADEGFLTAWYDSPDLETPIFIGSCFSPDLPPNNTPNTAIYTYYAIATNFSCASADPAVVEIHVRPQPNLILDGSATVCPGETFNLAALNIVDENFTEGALSFHSASPAGPENEITELVVATKTDTVFYALMVSTDGCSDEISIPLAISPGPDLSFSPTDSYVLCKESTTSVSVLAQGGSGQYDYNWSNGRNTPQINIKAGKKSGDVDIYGITVTDENGCLSTDSVIVQTSNGIDSIYRQVTNVFSCQGTEGSIALSPFTGLPPYTYQWSSFNGTSGSATSAQDTFVIRDLPQGSYRITITDSSSEQCAFLMRNVLVQGPAAVVASIQVEGVSCGGAADGRIRLNVIGNNPVYSWSNGANSRTIEQLSGGTYSVTITDGACSTVLSDIEVPEPDTIGFRASVIPSGCAVSGDGQITLNLFGGTGNYSLLWSDGETERNRINLAGGTYPFTITDSNNCRLSDSVFVEAPDTLSISLDSLKHLTCFSSNDGYLQVKGQGGTPPYRYEWDGGSRIPALFDLAAGTYRLTLTDYNGCVAIRNFEVQQPERLQAILVDQIAPLCEGIPDGAIEVAASGGTPDYIFEWQDNNTETRRTELPVGTYEVVVKDAHGCTSDPLSIALMPQKILGPGIEVIPPACVGQPSGSITLSPNGQPPYTAEWSHGANGLSLSDLTTGSYALILTDSRGCRTDSLITLNAPQVFDLDLTVAPPSCFGVSDGIVQVLVSKTGTPPFQFLWSDGSTEQDRFTLGAGDYQLTVSDALGCQLATDSIRLSEPNALKIEAFDQGQVSCYGASTGFIEVEITGGTQPYTINWLGQGVETPGIYGIPAGNYRLQVFDAENCPIDTTFIISQPPPLNTRVDLSRGDPCDPQRVTTLKAVVTGGTAPFQYLWSSGDSSATIPDAIPDDYTLTVTDARGCQNVIRSIKVRPQVAALVLDTFYIQDISCFGAADASMTAKISGGSGRYTYLFRPARLYENIDADSVTVGGLSLHNQYAVTVTDVESGCRVVSEVLTTVEPQPLSIQLEKNRAVQCFNGTDGAVEVKVSGGTLPYHFQWTNKMGTLVSEEEDLIQAPRGTYELLVTDEHHCTLTYSDSIASLNPQIKLANTTIRPIACFGEATGAINITASGGEPPFTYQWNTGATTEDLEYVPAGLYSLTLTDSDNCTATFPNIEVPEKGDLLEFEVATLPVSCFGASDGSASIAITGGTPPYDFNWFRNGQPIANVNEPQLNDLPAGFYTLEFSDNQGCSRDFEFEVTSPRDLVVNLQVNVPQPPDYDNGSASVIVSGGQPEYAYLWSTGDTTVRITDLVAGTYQLTVTDAQGCRDSIRLTLTDIIDPEIITSARLYPNPANDRVQLDLTFPRAIAGQLFIVDAVGRTVFQKLLPRQVRQEIPIDTRHWPSGIYQLGILYHGRIIYSERLIIIR